MIQNDCFETPHDLAHLWGDGILITTPMGSMGRALSLHGPIMHKEMSCMLLVPNCPLSLKFRPICIPLTNKLVVQVEDESRAAAVLGIDGMNRGMVEKGTILEIG